MSDKQDLALRIARRLIEEWAIGDFGPWDDPSFDRATDEEIAAVIREVMEDITNG